MGVAYSCVSESVLGSGTPPPIDSTASCPCLTVQCSGLPWQLLSRHKIGRLVALAADDMMPGPLTWHCC